MLLASIKLLGHLHLNLLQLILLLLWNHSHRYQNVILLLDQGERMLDSASRGLRHALALVKERHAVRFGRHILTELPRRGMSIAIRLVLLG